MIDAWFNLRLRCLIYAQGAWHAYQCLGHVVSPEPESESVVVSCKHRLTKQNVRCKLCALVYKLHVPRPHEECGKSATRT